MTRTKKAARNTETGNANQVASGPNEESSSSMSSLSHGCDCTLCKKTYKSRKSWLSHLLTGNHQILVRSSCLGWGEEEKRYVLVVYCSASLEHVGKLLLEYFSSITVKDFIWWPNTKHGLLQFESPEKVNQVLDELGERQRTGIQLTDYLVQFKRGSTCLSLEWSELIQKTVAVQRNDPVIKMEPSDSISNNNLQDADTSVMDWMNEAAVQSTSPPPQLIPKQEPQSHEDLSDISSVDSSCTEKLPETTNQRVDVTIKKENDPVVKLESSGSSSSNCPAEMDSTIETPLLAVLAPEGIINSSLSSEEEPNFLELDCDVVLKRCSSYTSQFIDIFKSIQVSEEKLKISQFIRTTLGPHGYEVNMYRNWYLKFGLSEQKPLLLHINKSEGGDWNSAELKFVQDKLLDGMKKESFLSDYEFKTGVNSWEFSNPITGASFSVQTDRNLIAEVQMCRLVEYLCTFDPRVRALLGLVYFWSKENDFKFSQENPSTQNVSVPLALDWLVIVFLCKTGMLPTVREIQDRHHQQIPVWDQELDISHDVGFETDPIFVEEWRLRNKSLPVPVYQGKLSPELSDKFILDILKLMQDFCHFVVGLGESGRKWIINSRDADVFDCHQFMERDSDPETKLTQDEVYKIRRNITEEELKIKGRRHMYFLHPSVLTWRISFNRWEFEKRGFKMLEMTEGLLRRYFTARQKYADRKGNLRYFLVHNDDSKQKIIRQDRIRKANEKMKKKNKRQKLNGDDNNGELCVSDSELFL